MENKNAQLNRGEEGFDRKVTDLLFNKLPFGRFPDAVASPRTEEEVVAAVRAARDLGRKVAVLSGGHSWIGASVRDGGLLIDLSAFDRIEVDAASRTARVGPAARSGDLAMALAAEGLAFPSGHCGTPAFGGYVLGGGLGLNWGRWKPACYSVRSARVVTAAGELVVASEVENPELLWLLRGSGPGFPGVITDFEIDLQDRPADTRVSSWLFAYDDLAVVGRWVAEVSRALPATVETATALLGPRRPTLRPSEGFPAHAVAVTAIAFADDAREAATALAPMDAGPGISPLAHQELEAIPFERLHEDFDAEFPADHRYLADTFWTDGDVGEALLPVADAFRRAPSPQNVVFALMPGNGGKLDLPLDRGAYSMNERTLVMPYSVWSDPAIDDLNRSWMEEVRETLDPLSKGHFVSEADLEVDPGRLARCFSPPNWERVVALRAKWDPRRLFHDPPGH